MLHFILLCCPREISKECRSDRNWFGNVTPFDTAPRGKIGLQIGPKIRNLHNQGKLNADICSWKSFVGANKMTRKRWF